MKKFLIFCGFLLLCPYAVLYAQASADSLQDAAAGWRKEGLKLVKEQHYEAAISAFQQSAAGFEKLGFWNDALQNYNSIGVAYREMGNFESQLKTVEYALQLIAEKLNGKSSSHARLVSLKGNALTNLRRQQEALDFLNAELEKLENAAEKDTILLFELYNRFGFVHTSLGDAPSAFKYQQQACALIPRVLILDPTYQRSSIPALVNFGIACMNLNRCEEAIKHYDTAIQIAKNIHDDGLQANALVMKGYALNTLGEYEPGLEYALKGHELYERSYGPDYPKAASVLTILATAERAMGLYEAALENYEKALVQHQKKGDTDSESLGFTMLNLGITWRELGRYPEALNAQLQAFQIAEKRFSKPHRLKNNIFAQLSDLYILTSAFPDSARYFAQRLLEESQAMYGARHQEVASGWNTLAFCNLKNGRLQDALNCAQSALIANSHQFSSTDYMQNPAPEDVSDQVTGMMYFERKAQVLHEIWKTKGGEAYKTAVLTCLEAGENLQQTINKNAGPADSNKEQAQHHFVFLKTALHISADHYEKKTDPETPSQCFRWMEKSKAYQLRQAAQNSRARAFAGLPDSLLQRDKQLSRAIAGFEQHLLEAEEQGDSLAVMKWRNDSLFQAKRNKEAFITRLERDYPNYFNLKYRDEAASLTEFQKSLPPKTLFLEYALGGREDSTLYILCISDKTANLYRRPLSPLLHEHILKANALLQTAGIARAPRRKEFVDLSHALYQQLIAPLESQLNEVEHLVVCGEGIMHYLPFEVLLPNAKDKPVQELDFLVRRFDISYHYSATLYSSQNRRKTTPPLSILAFAPVFNQEGALADISRDTSLRAVSVGGKWSPLPASEKEVNDIARQFELKKTGSSTVLLHEKATLKALKDGMEQPFSIVHIASHSFTNFQDPKFSGVACYAADSMANKGILYAGEIYNIAAQSDLTVLSSCESGIGRLVDGEGALGLNRAFLFTGIPNVVFSLWKVNDRATAGFMTHFYRGVLTGKPYSSSLRSAKLEMLKDPATASPNYWACFLGIFGGLD